MSVDAGTSKNQIIEGKWQTLLMASFSLQNYFKVLFDVSEETGDLNVGENEFVRMVGMRSDNKGVVVEKYFQHISEIESFIEKYKHNFNIFVSLSTVKGKSGKEKNMYRRRVLFFDFDRKSFPEYTSVEDFSKHIKSRKPELFNHVIVDSGNGFHFYVAIKESKNPKRVANANRILSEIVGADIKATLSTQIVRVPTSLNLKDKDNKKSVSIVANNLESRPDMFRPYRLNQIEAIVENHKINQEIFNKAPKTPPKEYTKSSGFFCVEAMLHQGVEEGERNFALGRIVNYLRDIRGWQKENVLREVLDWNKKCKPSKDERIVKQDFENYWEKHYKLLGCSLINQEDQQILYKYCDKTLCTSIFESNGEGIVEGKRLAFNNNIIQNKFLRKIT